MSGVLITITGPSLSGKSTLGDMLREKGFAVKATTGIIIILYLKMNLRKKLKKMK